jgi:hypothetical protein
VPRASKPAISFRGEGVSPVFLLLPLSLFLLLLFEPVAGARAWFLRGEGVPPLRAAGVSPVFSSSLSLSLLSDCGSRNADCGLPPPAESPTPQAGKSERPTLNVQQEVDAAGEFLVGRQR